MEEWIPKTDLGRRVKARQITSINEILDNGWTILEHQITESLVPGMEHDLLMIGQSKGKFGGGRRRVFRQTQKKTREGNKPRFAAYAVIGNGDGIVGLGYGKARETVPAREKAVRQAKLNIFKVARGSGSWQGTVAEPHTVPFSVSGRCGSVRIKLMPAPKGKGLVAEPEVQKILKAAGIEDVWMQSRGQTKNKINLIKALEQALRKLTTTKLRDQDKTNLHVQYGNVKEIAIAADFDDVKQKSAPRGQKVSVEPAPVVKEAKKDPVAEKPVVADDKPKKKEVAKAAPEGTPLSAVKGVGATTANNLRSAGFATAEQLAAASVDDLTAVEGIGAATAQKIIDSAKDVRGGQQ